MVETAGSGAWRRGYGVRLSQTSPPWGNNANNVVSVNGGPFIGNAANYQTYANQLTHLCRVLNMKNTRYQPLRALCSEQPDTDTTSCESCVWTGNQIATLFLSVPAALASSNVAATKFCFPKAFTGPIPVCTRLH